MAKIAAYRNCCENKPELVEIAIDSFKQLMNRLKHAKVRNPFAYFYRIADAKYQIKFYFDLFEEHGITST